MRNYDPAKIVVTFRGVQLTGFAEGTFLTSSREEDGFTKEVGADGLTTRIQNRNRSGMVSLTLQGASPSNDVLTNYARTDELTGFGYGELLVKDLNGTTLIAASDAWIRKIPDVEYAKDSNGGREWIFDCETLDIVVGGNTRAL